MASENNWIAHFLKHVTITTFARTVILGSPLIFQLMKEVLRVWTDESNNQLFNPITITMSLFSIQSHVMPFDQNITTFCKSLVVITSVFFAIWLIVYCWEDVPLWAIMEYLPSKSDSKGREQRGQECGLTVAVGVPAGSGSVDSGGFSACNGGRRPRRGMRRIWPPLGRNGGSGAANESVSDVERGRRRTVSVESS